MQTETISKNSKKGRLVLMLVILTVLLAIAVLSLPTSVVKGSYSTLVVSDVTAEAGGEVYVSVSVEGNPGMAGFLIDMEYDKEKLSPIEVIQGGLLSEGLFNSSISNDTVKVTWFDVADVTSDGELYAVKFRVLSGAKGSSPVKISYEDGNLANYLLESIEIDIRNGDVTIK